MMNFTFLIYFKNEITETLDYSTLFSLVFTQLRKKKGFLWHA